MTFGQFGRLPIIGKPSGLIGLFKLFKVYFLNNKSNLINTKNWITLDYWDNFFKAHSSESCLFPPISYALI